MIQKDLGEVAFAYSKSKMRSRATRLSTFSREKFEWRLPTYTPGRLLQLKNQSNAVSDKGWLLVRDQNFDAVLQLRY